jgi:hypothetical protein
VSIPQGSVAEGLFQALSVFKKSWPGGGYSWDSRLNCVASSFSTTLEADARAAVAKAFKFQWTSRTLRSAPEVIQEVADLVGGLRQDQLLVSMDPNEALMAYGLWWPWGDDVTISFRIGLAGVSSARYEDGFRELFGAAL